MLTGPSSFRQKVLENVRKIPRGSVLSYGDVAKLCGTPKIPCHRVICANGSLGEYNRGPEQKRKLLEQEGYGV